MSARNIKKIYAQQVFAPRHVMGVEAIVEIEGGAIGRATCNSGISVGTHEVKFAYDGGEKWGGKGVTKAVNAVNTLINNTLTGMDVTQQRELDAAMLAIGGNGKEVCGGNAIAAVSAALMKAGAKALDIPLYRYIGGERAYKLPVPAAAAFIGDDRWGGGVTNPGFKPSVSFQSYDFTSFSEASYAAWNVYTLWQEEMKKRGIPESITFMYIIQQGKFKDSDEAIFELMANCIHRAGYDNKVGIQIDFAADTYYDREKKLYRGLLFEKPRDRDTMLEYYIKLINDYPFVSVEDPFYEDDYESHAMLTEKVDIQVVGDDLFTTSKERMKKGAQLNACNAMLLKVNQVGSISDAFDAVDYAYECGYGVMPCESRGEGADIADYCVGIGAGSVREQAILSPAANRFLEIEAELGSRAVFWGKKGLRGKRFQKQ
jgi:enolase